MTPTDDSKFTAGSGVILILILSCFALRFMASNFSARKMVLLPAHRITQPNCSGINSNSDKCQNVPFYESLSVLLVSKQPLFTGCVNRNDPRMQKVPSTTQLKFEPIDCALFCVGRNYSRMNIRTDEIQSACFCSGDLPSSKSVCENSSTETNFKSYKLDPVSIPSVKVKRHLFNFPLTLTTILTCLEKFFNQRIGLYWGPILYDSQKSIGEVSFLNQLLCLFLSNFLEVFLVS